MLTSRERFEAWANSTAGATPWSQPAWEAWQAAEAQTARRCAELCGAAEDDYQERNSMKWPEMQSSAEEGARACVEGIRAEYPEVWK